MIYIYETFGHRISRFNLLGCVVKKKKTTKNEKRNVVSKNTEIPHFVQTSRRAFAFSKTGLYS